MMVEDDTKEAEVMKVTAKNGIEYHNYNEYEFDFGSHGGKPKSKL